MDGLSSELGGRSAGGGYLSTASLFFFVRGSP